jgi:hypothetical protein
MKGIDMNAKLYLLAVFILLALMSATSFAQDLPGEEAIPDYMKDGKITVTLKDGTTYEYSTNEYKVVRRGSKKAPAPIVADQKTEARREEKVVAKKNRLMLNGGMGYDGNNVTVRDNSVTVEDNMEPVFGLTYIRDLDDRLSVSAGFLTNGTATLGVGGQF